MENSEGVVWGEQVVTRDRAKEEFLMSSGEAVVRSMVQKLLLPLVGAELTVTTLVN